MQQTTNYGFKKPEMIDTVADSIPAYADNLDDIDTGCSSSMVVI